MGTIVHTRADDQHFQPVIFSSAEVAQEHGGHDHYHIGRQRQGDGDHRHLGHRGDRDHLAEDQHHHGHLEHKFQLMLVVFMKTLVGNANTSIMLPLIIITESNVVVTAS